MQRINLNNAASLRWSSLADILNLSHLQFKTLNFQWILGAEFCGRGGEKNDWKIANVIYIKVRLEETNYAGDSRQFLSSCPLGNNSIILRY